MTPKDHMATFRHYKYDWELFRKIAGRKNTTTSKILQDFVDDFNRKHRTEEKGE